MYLTTASLCLSLTWLLALWAHAAHRRPVPAAWTRFEAASSATVLVIVMLLPIGFGCLAVALANPLETLAAQSVLTAIATAAAPALAVLATPRLRRPLRGVAAQTTSEDGA